MNREQFFVDSELYDNLDANYNSLLIKYQKQKEVINKIQMIITDMQLELIGIKPYHSFVVDGNIIRNMTKNIEDILKEVSEWIKKNL